MTDQLYSNPEILARLRSGPLGAHIDGFAVALSEQGYSQSALKVKIRWIDYLNQWIRRRQIVIGNLNEQRIAEFLEYQRRERRIRNSDAAALRQLLHYLRDAGLVPKAVPKSDDSEVHPVWEEFARYLAQERDSVRRLRGTSCL